MFCDVNCESYPEAAVVTAIEKSFCADALWASVTLTVKLETPTDAGVPPIRPFPFMVSPAGSEPDTLLQLYGVVPPEAASCPEYAVPTVAAPSGDALVIVRGPGVPPDAG